MKYLRTLFIFILLLNSVSEIFAQSKRIDSLLGVLPKQKEDSDKVWVLAELSWELKNNGDYDNALKYIKQATDLSEKLKDTTAIGACYNRMGTVYYRQGKYEEALNCQTISLELAQKINDKKSLSVNYNSIGLVHQDLGNYAESIRNYFLALTIDEEMKDKKRISDCYGNIGIAYHYMGNDSACLRYFNYALKMKIEVNDKPGMAFSYNNIGAIQIAMEKYDEAFENLNKSLELKLSLGQKRGVAAVYMNLGDLFSGKKEYEKALEYYEKAMTIFEKSGDKNGIMEGLINFGVNYTKLNRFSEANKSLNDALEIAKQSGSKSGMKACYRSLAELGVAEKNYEMAYTNYVLYSDTKDSIQNDETTKKATRAEMNYEFDKKQAIKKIEQEKIDLEHQAESKNQRTVIYFGAGILLLVIVFAIYAYRGYLQKQKANVELDDKNHKIEHAYKIIEHKNTEITDSINYAKKIQHSILPDRADFIKAFPKSFVFYRPKDIVGGDFYYLNEIKGEKFLAVADCTGHGVPGAFMSLVGSRELLLANEKSNSVSTILSNLNRGMKETLKQNQLDKTKDGMDIALLRFNGNKISFSSANRPLWIFKNEKKEMLEVRATKAAIGGFTPDDQIFEQHELDLESGDCVFVFSDGYSDQFGGEKGKKMTSKRFRDFLIENSAVEFNEQGKTIETYFDKWRGRNEQIDDVLVIGMQI